MFPLMSIEIADATERSLAKTEITIFDFQVRHFVNEWIRRSGQYSPVGSSAVPIYRKRCTALVTFMRAFTGVSQFVHD